MGHCSLLLPWLLLLGLASTCLWLSPLHTLQQLAAETGSHADWLCSQAALEHK